MNSARILLFVSLFTIAGCSASDIDWSKITVCSDAGSCTDGKVDAGASGGRGGETEQAGTSSSMLPATDGVRSGASGESHDVSGAGGTEDRSNAPPSAGAGGSAGSQPTDEAGSGSSAPQAPRCGDGHVDGSEVCDGNCLSECPPPTTPTACVHSTLTGSATHCDVECMSEAITTCGSADGCCPSTCTHATDPDCSAKCGDGVVDPDEKCEPKSTTQACPTDCDDHEPCTMDMLVGSASSCSAECAHIPITAAHGGDGCCPPDASANNDSDCSPKCGNGVTEKGETCDGDDCPTSSTCTSSDACHPANLEGSVSACSAICKSAAITAAISGDGCCPAGSLHQDDSDCTAECASSADCGSAPECHQWMCSSTKCVSAPTPNVACSGGGTCGSDGSCKVVPACGNGMIDRTAGEQCDRSAGSNKWECTDDCKATGLGSNSTYVRSCSTDSQCADNETCKISLTVGALQGTGPYCYPRCNDGLCPVPSDWQLYNSPGSRKCGPSDECLVACTKDAECPSWTRCLHADAGATSGYCS